VAFFMSHRKVWAFVREENGRVTVLFAGSANKNKPGFEKIFTTITDGADTGKDQQKHKYLNPKPFILRDVQ